MNGCLKFAGMPQSFNSIWIHSIWSTKEQQPLIVSKAESKVHAVLHEEFVRKGCPVKIINGMPDHVHCLFMLNPHEAISDILKCVKGTSSHSINFENIVREKFAWQQGYAAYSVSQSQLEKVFHYIKNQKKLHLKLTFDEEAKKFIKLHGEFLSMR
jgi:putative transposase